MRRVQTDSTIDEVVRAVCAHAHARLLPAIDLSAAALDADTVHDGRVAARRARSDLRTLRPLLDRKVVDPLRGDLRWVGTALGHVRDLDVIGELVRGAARGHHDPRVGGVVRELDRQRSLAIVEVQREIASERYRNLLVQLHDLTAAPPIGPSVRPSKRVALVAPRLVRRAWRHLDREITAVRSVEDEDGLHEVRKAAKRVRYAVELLAPVLDDATVEGAKVAKLAQQQLGDHRDHFAATQWLRAVGRSRPELHHAAQELARITAQAGARDPLDWDGLVERLRDARAGSLVASRS